MFTFELAILFSNVVLPAALALLGLATARVVPERLRDGWAVAVVSIGGALSIWLATGVRNGFTGWPDEAWLRVPIGSMLVALASVATLPKASNESGWVIRSLAILVATWCVLPSGDGFANLLPAIPRWQLWISTVTIVGWWAIERTEDRLVYTVGLAWLVLMAAGTVLVGQSFAKLAEITLAIGTVWLATLAGGWWQSKGHLIRAAAGPILFAWVAAVCNGRFNSFLGLPDWLSLLAIASPTIVAGTGLLLPTRIPAWCRRTIAGVLAIGIASFVVWRAIGNTTGSY